MTEPGLTPGDSSRDKSPLKVRIVVDPENQGWILGKFARRLVENLPHWNVVADIGTEPSPDADLNHWILFMHTWSAHFREPGFYSRAWRRPSVRGTVMITHVDSVLKTLALREALDKVADLGICMSRMTVQQLISDGIDASRLTYVSPAHDGAIAPRRLVVGITSRVYSDGRKREYLLSDVAASVRLDPFHFEIIGSGWDAIIPKLRDAGASVSYFVGTDDAVADYEIIKEKVRTFDYYFYPGRDEGSTGILDALAAGAKTIVVPQGFHLDIPGGIDHPFDSSDDLIEVFRSIAGDYERRTGKVRSLTWDLYAQRHADIWRALIESRGIPDPGADLQSGLPEIPHRNFRDHVSFRGSMYSMALRDGMMQDYLTSRKFKVRGLLSRVKRIFLPKK